MALLELHGITKSFGATAALKDVDLGIEAGEVHALIGENGAGKTTLLNILSGALPPDSGKMFFNGRQYSPRGPADARTAGITHIHQELSLCAHMTVAENISLGVEPARAGFIDRGGMRHRAETLLQDFGCAHIRADRRVGSLPLPDQQVVEICRALASNSSVVLMDEPTSSLTRHSVEQLFRLIRRLRDQGITIIYISHFLEEVREVAKRFTVLRDGKSAATGELDAVTDRDLVGHMVGRESQLDGIFARRPARESSGNGVALRVRNLASPPKLRSASFDLRRAEVLGIGGLVGSGRTELVRALFGLDASTGEIELHGKRITHLEPSRQIARGVGYLSEDRKREGLCVQLSVADNLTASAPARAAHFGWLDLQSQQEKSDQIIARLRIRSARPAVPVLRLSGGNQQKVAFGRLLYQDPDILLLDEPTRGVDIRSKSELYAEIRALAAAGKAILMVSSYLPELLAMCDRIGMMSRGVLSPVRDAGEWTPQAMMEAAIAEHAPAPASEAR